jgi:hypothetical protein
MVAGAFIFSGWELLTTGLDRLKRLRFRGDVSGEFDFTRILQWCLFGTIAIHLFSNILSPMEHQNILLYALIPLFYFLHLRRDQQYLSFAVLAAFVYANGFMFYGMIDFFSTYSLTGLHLTSLSFIFSIAVFAGFRRAMQ